MLKGRCVFKSILKVFCVTSSSSFVHIIRMNSNRDIAVHINTNRQKASGNTFGHGDYLNENKTFSIERVTSFPSSLTFIFRQWPMFGDFILHRRAFDFEACSHVSAAVVCSFPLTPQGLGMVDFLPPGDSWG